MVFFGKSYVKFNVKSAPCLHGQEFTMIFFVARITKVCTFMDIKTPHDHLWIHKRLERNYLLVLILRRGTYNEANWHCNSAFRYRSSLNHCVKPLHRNSSYLAKLLLYGR